MNLHVLLLLGNIGKMHVLSKLYHLQAEELSSRKISSLVSKARVFLLIGLYSTNFLLKYVKFYVRQQGIIIEFRNQSLDTSKNDQLYNSDSHITSLGLSLLIFKMYIYRRENWEGRYASSTFPSVLRNARVRCQGPKLVRQQMPCWQFEIDHGESLHQGNR